MDDFERLQKVVSIMKIKFNNLSVTEVNDLGIKIVKVLREEASFRSHELEGLIEVFGSADSISRLDKLLNK